MTVLTDVALSQLAVLDSTMAYRESGSPDLPTACRSDLPFLMDLTARILDAVADRLLVNIQSDVIHMSLRSLRGRSLNQRSC